MALKPSSVDRDWLRDFVVSSNAIEGIFRDSPSLRREVDAVEAFLQSYTLGSHELLALVGVLQPEARIRTEGEGIVVGSHVAPPGGKHMLLQVVEILLAVQDNDANPIMTYMAWQHLHPLTDGNGRTGRVLYAWQVIRWYGVLPRRNFLEEFHYETLAVFDKATGSKGWRGLVVK